MINQPLENQPTPPQAGIVEKKSGCTPGCGCGCFMGCILFFILSIAASVAFFLLVDFGKVTEQGFYWVYKAASQAQLIEKALPPEMPVAERKETLKKIDETVDCYFRLSEDQRKQFREEIKKNFSPTQQSQPNSQELSRVISECLKFEKQAPPTGF